MEQMKKKRSLSEPKFNILEEIENNNKFVEFQEKIQEKERKTVLMIIKNNTKEFNYFGEIFHFTK